MIIEIFLYQYLESVALSPIASVRRDSQHSVTPNTASTRRKRKRLAEAFSSFVQNADSPAVHKRRSSVSDAGHLSVSGSFLDCTASPDKQLLDGMLMLSVTNNIRKFLSIKLVFRLVFEITIHILLNSILRCF